ncbi:uncharacterized protein At3g49140-like isoform X2 [Tasmannia lanceolata]|uniref:uncharacterized protein At3g49140-like isoform X2 n=1 Tax=Tasmannia lanceolata TaxID=3420 RepID=UPI004062A8E7
MESAMAVGFSSVSIATSRSSWNLYGHDDPAAPHLVCRRPLSQCCAHRFTSKRISQASDLAGLWLPRGIDGCSFKAKNNILKNRCRAAAEYSDSMSDPMGSGRKSHYHPSEEIRDSVLAQGVEDARLTDAEMTRTITEVNSKAILMVSGVANDEVQENIFWPELPYVTDQHGDIYFKVRNTEDILQTITADNNFVQVLIGLDNIEMLSEMDLSGPADIDFGIDEITDEDSDIDDDFEEDWVAILEDEEDDDFGSSETLGDWANLETMRSCHPLYFSRKMAEVVSDQQLDWISQPSSGLAIQGLLRPAFIEEHSIVRKNIAGYHTSDDDKNQVEKILEDNEGGLGVLNSHECGSGSQTSSKHGAIWADESEKDENPRAEYTFYKLEMINIQLVSAYGNQTAIEVKDFRKARPDVIAHSAAKIISRLKAGGEKSVHALKSLCWRSKGIQVEEAALIGMDSLGFDLRVCSGTQVQTLRFSFNTRATSEYSAERQLHDLLFPKIHQNLETQFEAHQKEC